eukprot:TRINITY_DN6951_c0_g1_i3.p1 TRINITY_DN6951_c0_g1~~TRINITY_DN6951_c0_g1_i3.p1  ORF type:complete len:100 (+),score=3.78 TRINITY_DN6951_c0_g1_i3:21-320(+)
MYFPKIIIGPSGTHSSTFDFMPNYSPVPYSKNPNSHSLSLSLSLSKNVLKSATGTGPGIGINLSLLRGRRERWMASCGKYGALSSLGSVWVKAVQNSFI